MGNSPAVFYEGVSDPVVIQVPGRHGTELYTESATKTTGPAVVRGLGDRPRAGYIPGREETRMAKLEMYHNPG